MKSARMFAVDLGASGGKCFAGTMDDGTFVMKEVHRFAHGGVSFFTADRQGTVSERTQWDDVLLYQSIVTGLQNYRREVADTLDSIGIDTWGADGQFITPDGDLLGKVYCYRDHRLDNMIPEVQKRIEPSRVYELTGIHFWPFNVSNQILWFMMNRKHLLPSGSIYLPVPSLFYFYLGGVKKVDSSWASVTQLMDAKTRQWSPEMLAALGIPLEVMPEIVEPGTVVGALQKPLADVVGLNEARLIAVASHDTASAFAAAPVENAADALIISSGTWSLVGRLVPKPITTAEAMAVGLSNEGGIGNIRFLRNCMGTWLMQELRRAWKIADGREMGYDEMIKASLQAPAFVSLIDPNHPSFYNPSNMEQAIAEFCRDTRQAVPSTRGAFVRCVHESLALKYRQINEQICAVCGTQTKSVNVVGGGSRDDVLNQFTADALGVSVHAGPEEATAVGNFMVQAIGLGLLRGMEEAQPVIRRAFPIRTFKPREPEPWSKAYARFITLTGK
jgi:rhamnulokinase